LRIRFKEQERPSGRLMAAIKQAVEHAQEGRAPSGSRLPVYVLVTPARNEAAFIELTLKSVIAQTVLPLKWVIVSDGSTDDTDEIVKRYAKTNDWIELVRMPEHRDRDFAAKVYAFEAGYARVKHLEYDIIGNLDADVSFDSDFFSFLLGKFAEFPRLGVGGAAFLEGSERYDYRFTSIEHVSGPCQMFRRQCFEEIGGYVPQKGGGIDLVAVLKARMHGWQTRTFPEKIFVHHRKMGTAEYDGLVVNLKRGEKDYVLGAHPIWEVFRCVYQMTKPPYVVSGCALLTGYIRAFLYGLPRSVTPEIMAFRRAEQMARLRKFILRKSSLPVGTNGQSSRSDAILNKEPMASVNAPNRTETDPPHTLHTRPTVPLEAKGNRPTTP
jgi:biofilm PGA synthesis N-glycosyltransferase PgaC